MALFDKFKKKEEILQQDLKNKDEHQGMIFIVHLLLDKICDMPDKEQ